MRQDLFRCGNINLVVCLLVILFGVSSWVDINGLWVELPILVQHLPESWDLPSYMAVIIQIANIAPLLYTIASALYPHRVLDVPVSYLIISLGAVSCLLLAFLWDYTSIVAGRLHSTALFGLQFCLALVDCTSSVVFLPFMSRLKARYMPVYFIGEGFSGLIPSLVALGQGAGSMRCVEVPFPHNESISTSLNCSESYITNHSQPNSNCSNSNIFILNTSTTAITAFPVYEEPRFSVRTFFLLLMTLMILSFISFALLNCWSYTKREFVGPNGRDDDRRGDPKSIQAFLKDNHNDAVVTCDDLSLNESECEVMGSVPDTQKKISNHKFALFLLLTIWINALSNGVLPSIQTYACLPYGIQVYHLSVNMASIANPVACVALLFLKMKSATGALMMSAVGTMLATYIICSAASSPSPPLVDHYLGSLITIFSWTLTVFLLTYSKVAIATTLRSKGQRGMLWVGAASQAGSLTGACATFLLVNVYKLFTVANPCI